MPPPWRNGLACWTSNSKVVGSSPTGGGFFFFIYFGSNLFEGLNGVAFYGYPLKLCFFFNG